MTERLTIAQVRKMEDMDLLDAWYGCVYPFDMAFCHNCVIQHARHKSCCEKTAHTKLIKELPEWRTEKITTINYIRKHLVKLFAMRRKYARFYKKEKP